MTWDMRGVVEKRLEFVERAQAKEDTIVNLCKEYGISRPTGYLWLNRYAESGSVSSLIDRSRTPISSPNKTAKETEDKIVTLRNEYLWGPKKIKKLLLDKEGKDVPLITVRRIYKRNGFCDQRSVIGPAPKRFERGCPNELLQMDFKGQFMMNDQRWCFPLSIIDDHSRYCVGLYALDSIGQKNTEPAIIRSFEKYGVPQAMLMDHGTPWWNHSNGFGLTKLSVALIKQGIKLSFSGIRHPQTQGKVERFNRTLKDALRLKYKNKLFSLKECAKIFEEFQDIYNSIRPHESVGMNPPASRYKPSGKKYNPKPRSWEYQPGAELVKVDLLGRISFEGKRYFVCEALPNEYVQLIEYDESILVIYRDMIIRELDSDEGSSSPLVISIKNFSLPGLTPGGIG
jgi:transposase InsO family protein